MGHFGHNLANYMSMLRLLETRELDLTRFRLSILTEDDVPYVTSKRDSIVQLNAERIETPLRHILH